MLPRLPITPALIALAFAACTQTDDDPRLQEPDIAASERGLPKAQGGTNGDSDYCIFNNPCLAGEGDCDQDTHCVAGVDCFVNVGTAFGFSPGTDMCLEATCFDGVLNGTEVQVDCGPGCIPCPSAISTFGRGGTGSEVVYDATQDTAGNIIVVGSFNGDTDLGSGSTISAFGTTNRRDVFVVKYAADGTHVWTRRFGGDFSDGDGHVAVSTGPRDEIAVAGNFHDTADFDPGPATANLTSNGWSDIFVVMLEPNGDLRWAESFGGTGYDIAYGVEIDAGRNVQVVGAFEGTVDFGGGDHTSEGQKDVFVLRLFGSNGAYDESMTFGGTGDDRGRAISSAPNRVATLVGTFTATATFDRVDLVSEGFRDTFVMQINPYTLRRTWVTQLGGVREDDPTDIEVDSSGNIYVAGQYMRTVDFGGGDRTSEGGFDAYLVSFDSSGSYRWDLTFGGSSRDHAGAVGVDSASGDLGFVGFVQGTVTGVTGLGSGLGGADVFSLVIDSSDGTLLEAERDGSSSSEEASGVVLTGNVLTTLGHFDGSATFGVTALTPSGTRDLYFYSRTY